MINPINTLEIMRTSEGSVVRYFGVWYRKSIARISNWDWKSVLKYFMIMFLSLFFVAVFAQMMWKEQKLAQKTLVMEQDESAVILIKTPFDNNWHHFSQSILPLHSRLDKSRVPRVLYVLLDESFRNRMKPIFRLFISASISSVSTEEIHFIIPRSVSIAADNKFCSFQFSSEDEWVSSMSQPMERRFVQNEVKMKGRFLYTVELPFLGEHGLMTWERGSYFSPQYGGDALMRSSFQRVCGISKPLKVSGSKVVLYQRDGNRRLLDEDRIKERTETMKNSENENFTVKVVVHDDERPPCELVDELKDVYALLTPHGFQTLVLLFLPRNSMIFEVFPYKYSKDNSIAYCALAREYHVRYAMTLSRPTSWKGTLLSYFDYSTCASFYHCRLFSRNQDVSLDECSFGYWKYLLSFPKVRADDKECPGLTSNANWKYVHNGGCRMLG